MKNTKKIAILSMTVAVAMILSFIESQIPPLVAIPGVKIGLANIAIVFALYKFGVKEAIIVSLIRLFLISLLFGNFASMLYGLGGAVLSLTAMILLKKLTPLSAVGVSVAGGVCHNIGQIIVAAIVMSTDKILIYLPVLIISGSIAGVVIGLLGGILATRIKLK